MPTDNGLTNFLGRDELKAAFMHLSSQIKSVKTSERAKDISGQAKHLPENTNPSDLKAKRLNKQINTPETSHLVEHADPFTNTGMS